MKIDYKYRENPFDDQEIDVAIFIKKDNGELIIRHSLNFLRNDPDVIEEAKRKLYKHVIWFVDEKRERVILWRRYGFAAYHYLKIGWIVAKVRIKEFIGRG